MSEKGWKKFERLVAALHIAEQKGAKVTWSDFIEGRQFDVTVRFKAGLYNYLTVIECKNFSKPVPVEKVEAFVTKSKGVNADKAIMISSQGFQSGAIQVAEKNNIALISLKRLNELSDEEIANDLSPVLLLFNFRFKLWLKQNYIVIPEEIGILRLFMQNSKIIGKEINTNIEELVKRYEDEAESFATNIPKTIIVNFPLGTELIHPNSLFKYKVSSFLFDYCLVSVNNLITTVGLGLDRYLSGDYLELKYEPSGETKIIDTFGYNLGFDTKLEIGRFYENPKLGFYYYCENIVGNEISMTLVESYQGGNLIQADFTISSNNINQFVEITDKKEILRLKKIYEKLKPIK